VATNLLFLPVVLLQMNASTNADWLDGIEYWTDETTATPIDLAGIEFAMEMRTAPPVATVVLKATTDNGLIQVYQNTWQFLVAASIMSIVPPADYVFDLLGIADGRTRNLVQAQVTVDQGITRTVIPVPSKLPAPSIFTAQPSLLRVTGTTKKAA